MAAGNWIIYDSFKEWIGDASGPIDLDGDSFRCALMTSSYTPSLSAHTGWADTGVSTNEIASTFGYTTPGQTISGVTWTKTGSTTEFDTTGNIAQWTATGGSITARYAIIYDDTVVTTPISDPLVCYCLLDTTPADVTATDGNTFTITPNASGIFTLSGATT